MEAKTGKTIVRGIAIAVGYCAAFLGLWHVSVDQWYLPAGLRLASLLLLPMRYWPYVFAGDAAALLTMRIPKAEQYSVQWAYLSPLLLVTSISVVPLFIKRKSESSRIILDWLPLIALISSIWSTVLGRLINLLLSGPTPPFTIERFISFCIGDFLGILIVMLPCLLWLQRQQWRNTHTNIVQSIAIGVLVIAALYAAAMIPGVQGSSVRLMPLVCMLLVVVYLTLLHGWHGAAVGTLLVNVAISLALPRIHLAGSADDTVLMAQAVLAVAAAGLLAVGVRISILHERSGASLRAELLALHSLKQHQTSDAHAMGAVRATFQSFEQRFREKALLLAYAREDLDAYRHAVAQTLKDEGLYRQAMEAISAGMEAAKALERHSEQLYPFEIETHGLYAVLTSDAFAQRWQGRARLRHVLHGRSPRHLSLPLRLATFRAVCSAMDALTPCEPAEFAIRVRGWRRRGRVGITVFVNCTPTTAYEPTPEAQIALQELAALVRAYDGTLKHRHTHRIGFLMSEPGASD